MTRPPAASDLIVLATDQRSNQQNIPLDIKRWAVLAELVLLDEQVTCGQLGLVFVDSDAIARLNRDFLGEDTPTDVLAFPIDAVSQPAGGALSQTAYSPSRTSSDMISQAIDTPSHITPSRITLLGDVAVCPDYVFKAQAHTHAECPSDEAERLNDEIALLVVHGVLHILGYDHNGDDEHNGDGLVMRTREKELLKAHYY